MGCDVPSVQYRPDGRNGCQVAVSDTICPRLHVTDGYRVARRLGKRDMHDRVMSRVEAAARVIIESSAVTWIGVTAYFVATLMTDHNVAPLSVCARTCPGAPLLKSRPQAKSGGYEATQMVFAALSVLFVRGSSDLRAARVDTCDSRGYPRPSSQRARACHALLRPRHSNRGWLR
jgi:hypothetical protein